MVSLRDGSFCKKNNIGEMIITEIMTDISPSAHEFTECSVNRFRISVRETLMISSCAAILRAFGISGRAGMRLADM